MSAGFNFTATLALNGSPSRLRIDMIPLAGFFHKLPTVEARALGLAVVKNADFLAKQVIPILAVELEIVGGVLALVHLREIVFGEAQIFEREFLAVEEAAHIQIVVLIAHFHRDAALAVLAADVEPLSFAGLIAIAGGPP